MIGEIVEVNASVTTLTDENSAKLDSKYFGGIMSENACFPLLPIFKFWEQSSETLIFIPR